MAIKTLVNRYKAYEKSTLVKRAERKKKLAPYKDLAEKRVRKTKPGKKFSVRKFTTAMGNPYGTKFPKAKKKLVKVKKSKVKRKRRKKGKRIVVYV